MEKEIKVTEEKLENVDIDNLPEIISSQVDALSDLEGKVNEANDEANKAKEYVDKNMSSYEEKGKWIFKHKSGNTKDIINDTQIAVNHLSTAQQATSVALKKSFEFQQKLAEASKYLFFLGCINMTANRTVVRELELKMSGASKEKLSALAREELCNVVRQLKEQEDIMKKQEFLTSKMKETVTRLNDKDKVDEKRKEAILKNTNSINSIENTLKEKDSLDEDQSREISSLKTDLSEKEKIDEEQTQRLEELRALLKNKDSLDQRQEDAIKENKEAIKILFDYMEQKKKIDESQQNEIEILKKIQKSKIKILPIVFSIVALLLSIISLLKLLNIV